MTSEDKTNTSSQNTKLYNDEHVESTNFPSSQSTTISHHRSTKWLIGLLGILVILFIGGGVFAFVQRSSVIQPDVSVVTPTTNNPQLFDSAQSEPTTVVSDVTSDWQTYRNEEYGFEFKYPPFFVLNDTNNNRLLFNHNIILTFPENSCTSCKGDCLNIDNIIDIVLPSKISAIKYTGTIGSVAGNIPESFIAYELKNEGLNKLISIQIWELPQDISYQEKLKQFPISREVKQIQKSDEELLDQILSTFRFL